MTETLQKNLPLVPAFYDPSQFRLTEQDRTFFDVHLRSFVPTNVFDVHAHWYDLKIFAPEAQPEDFDGNTWVGHDRYEAAMSGWMGDRCPRHGLFFPMPIRGMDTDQANSLLLAEARQQAQSRCLLMIRPTDDAAAVERQLRDRSVAGFKVYHRFARRDDTFNAPPNEYIPQWAWELADHHGLCIMLHIVMSRSLAEPANQKYIVENCRRYPNARLILAHAARGFCGRHTVEGIDALRGFGNVYFDNSVACEPEALESILQVFGTTRLMFGSDFPISEARGRAVNLGDGFHWLYEQGLPPVVQNQVTLVGIESLLALKHACRSHHLTDSDVERIFSINAREMLGISNQPPATNGSGQALYLKAKKLIPGGTQLVSKRPEQYAPDKWPAYFSEARGCEVVDLDCRHYLDFATSGIGTCLLGYANPAVTDAVLRRVQLGSMSTLNSPEDVELAELLLGMHPWAQKIRLGRSGGEALAIAVRIARAGTRKDVVAFCGYHGWSDWYLAANLGDSNALAGHLLPGLSPAGVPGHLRGSALPFNYNKIDELRAIVRQHGSTLAAVVMEPTRAVMPDAGFLEEVRQICDEAGIRLIFDEVTAGFRQARGGVHLKLGVLPDIAVFAKALGNGHPIAAIIGTAAAMDAAQDSFISSTYWTEGVGAAAAVATLKEMKRIDVPAHVGRIGTLVRDGMASIAKATNVPLKLSGHPAQMYLGFENEQADALMTLYVVRMLERGFLVGGAFYPTLAHNDNNVAEFLNAAMEVFAELSDSLRAGDASQRVGGNVKHSGFRRLN